LQVIRRIGQDARWNRFSIGGGVKLPTADVDEGLGSGEADYWAGIAWRREGWSIDLSAHLDYVRLGDPEWETLQDGPAAGFGVEWPLDRRGFYVGAEAGHPVLEGDPVRLSAIGGLWGSLGRSRAWSAGISAGLTESAPDLGFSVTLRL